MNDHALKNHMISSTKHKMKMDCCSSTLIRKLCCHRVTNKSAPDQFTSARYGIHWALSLKSSLVTLATMKSYSCKATTLHWTAPSNSSCSSRRVCQDPSKNNVLCPQVLAHMSCQCTSPQRESYFYDSVHAHFQVCQGASSNHKSPTSQGLIHLP